VSDHMYQEYQAFLKFLTRQQDSSLVCSWKIWTHFSTGETVGFRSGVCVYTNWWMGTWAETHLRKAGWSTPFGFWSYLEANRGMTCEILTLFSNVYQEEKRGNSYSCQEREILW